MIHILINYPKLQKSRRQLRSKIEDIFNNISAMLGDMPQNKAKGCVINRDILNAVLEFAEAL